MEHGPARHIGDILKERGDVFQRPVQIVLKRRTTDQLAPAAVTRFVFRPQKLLRPLLCLVLDVLATIGWFVTLPFITRDASALTTREQFRG